MKLLLIEDNEQISQGLSYFFQKNNYDIDVVKVECFDDALSYLKDNVMNN